MQLTSLTFLAFVLLLLPVHGLLPSRARPLLLLLASLLFYAGAVPLHALLIVAMALTVYLGGCALHQKQSRALYVALILLCVGVLGYFKYWRLLCSMLDFTATGLGWQALHAATQHLQVEDVRVPLGISFFTFEFVHYLTDIRLQRLTADRPDPAGAAKDPGRPSLRGARDFLLFTLFFPTLLAGPIKRFQSFGRSFTPTGEDLAAGLARVLLGLGKKVLLADSLASMALRLAQPDQTTPHGLWLAMYAYAGQIYLDFSGYSDVAIGLSRCLGYRIPENFNWPYSATSLPEFWRRWHISLSSWIRDYLFIPLGGSRQSPARVAFNLLLVMAACGLWHGAAGHFVLWGLWHGLGLGACRLWRRFRPAPTAPSRLLRAWYWLLTFHFVCFGWVLFAAPSLQAALQAVARMFSRVH